MPTRLPARDPFRPLAIHATRRDRLTVFLLLLGSALLTFGVASATHRIAPNLVTHGPAA